MTKARYYKAKVRVCDQDGTSNCTSYSSPSSAFALPAKLAKPTNLDVEPMLFRKAKIDWAGDLNAGSYTIKQTGSETADIKVKDATEEEIALDDYLDDDIVDTFRIKAVSASDLYEDSDYSDTIRIVDNPILRADGDNSSLASSATTGSSTITWKKIAGVTKYTIKYRKMPGTSLDKHSNREWTVDNARTPLLASTVTYSAPPTKTRLTHTKTGLLLGEIYSIQLNYEQNGQKVFSGRDAYVWPSRGFPAEDKRVATYPYFGHWPDREFTYRICENTLVSIPQVPADTLVRARWINLINAAFEQWETATDGLITITRDTTSTNCLSSKTPTSDTRVLTPLEILLVRQYPHKSDTLHINDVYVVDNTGINSMVGIFTDFIGRYVQGQCLFRGEAPACTVTKGYGSSAEASTQLRNTLGSDNGVDIMFAKSIFNASNMDIPSSVKFNYCRSGNSIPDQNKYYAYTTALHEAGHALGASGYSDWDLLRFIGKNGRERGEREIYKRAHPSIPDAVMNYNERITGVSNEPDCSPHPFDILAIWALYQTVDR